MTLDRGSSGPAEPARAEPERAARARVDFASTRGAIRLLWALLVASILVPAALFAAAAWYDWREVNEQTLQTANRMAQILREHALKVFESHEFALDAVDDRIGGLDWSAIGTEEVHRFLARLVQRHEQVSEILILNPEGKVVSTSSVFPAPMTDTSEREYFRVPSGDYRRTFIGPPSAAGASGPRLINISRRRSAPDNQFNGVIVVALSLDRFSAFYRSITAGAENSVTMARTDGAVLVREPPTTTGASRLSPSSGFVQAARSGRANYRTVAELDGVERVHAIEQVGQYPVHVSYGLSLAGMNREWQADLMIFAIFAGGAAAGLCGITWLSLRRTRAQRRLIEQWQDEVHRREAAEEALRQTQKMEALGQLTGGVAHDFNNLLMVVTGNIEVLKKKLDPGAGAEPQLAAIDAAARHGESLTRQLLAFARRQPVQPQTIDLFHALPRLIDLIRPSLRGDIGLAADAPPDVWPIRVDPGELELAMLNVAINARDAMPQTGRLSVAVENRTLRRGDVGRDNLTGDFVALAISDTGRGIAADVLPRVFEPFFSTKGLGEGTGLGLSQVYGFARQSGGAATIESEPGKGTTVTLYLPRSESFALAEGPPAVPDGPSDMPRHILLVEDNGEVAEATKGMLAALRCTVVCASDGNAALRMLADGLKVDLVLTDILMPGNLDGVALANAVRARYDLPVVLTTGYSTAAQRAAGEQFPLLTKPYRSEDLRRALRAATAATGERRVQA